MISTDPIATDLVDFIAASPTPFHAVEATKQKLGAAGFRAISFAESWSSLAPGRYWVEQGDSAIGAFVLPDCGEIDGFRIVGAHTDSPNLRLKPNAEYVREGYLQLGVEVYGGALLNSWLDRDLSVAGRAIVRARGGRLESRLVRCDRPILRVAQLAIHLDRDVNERGLVLHRQEHLPPIVALSSGEANRIGRLCAEILDVEPDSIVHHELMLFDVVPPTIGGLNGEFIFAPRLDNLAMCHAAITALIDSAATVERGALVPLVALFDHEEIGSHSAYGAASPFLAEMTERIALSRGAGGRDSFHRAIARSFCVSADMAHAVHPNYPERHEPRHRIAINSGPVIKINSQQRYATCARTAAMFGEICRSEAIPFQTYSHRTDLPCGSTIGPIAATLLGVRTIDVGNPMLSMHSAREMAGVHDPARMVRALSKFAAIDDLF